MNYERIDELLRMNKMSRRQLAREIGISPGKMQVWFQRGTKKIAPEIIAAIAEVLGIAATDITGVPRKPIERAPLRLAVPGSLIYVCRFCGQIIYHDEDYRAKFCMECGRKVDWEGCK